MPLRRNALFLLLAVLAVLLGSCAEEEYPASIWVAEHPAPDAGLTSLPVLCAQARAQSLPARLVAMSANATSGSEFVPVGDLVEQFQRVCGSCHGTAVDQPMGGFQIKSDSDFVNLMTPAVLQMITNSVCPGDPRPGDPNDPMPPCSSPNGATYGQRTAADPVYQFAELVKQWLAAGSPAAGFTPGGGGGGSTVNAYALTPHDGNSMTNIGNCVPVTVRFDASKALTLDKMFAGLQAAKSGAAAEMIGLPEKLSQTDLVTFDSSTLAEYGVIAYAPGYPLWSDNAGKLRHVRVPVGQSIRFDPATQQFAIPPNTRFYKTFMKLIADTDGSYRYRKIETRLIVSRPDQNNADGSVTQTALFGSYKWRADESEAELVETPLRNAEPWSDTEFLYNVDEQLAAAVLAQGSNEPEVASVEAGASRHYAIPSKARCIQCHMGSPSQSFVLGFTPLQINRRPPGEGGVIEATGPDELTQLQRLIDAGVITGIHSASDVLPLEESQGSRRPRNDYELVAQGYMLGNCAHCHNPRGYPTVQNPVLKDVLDFLPSATGGGIFQFPLERYSPRIARGLTGSTPIPYVTPSLVDLPRFDPASGAQAADIFVYGGGGFGLVAEPPYSVAYAPWRSIIYRNVDAAFAYTDDDALYPHMPFNTPGYDPRAKQILGDWMVSIPAVRKHPELGPEYSYQTGATTVSNIGSPTVDSTPQPYAEVPAGAPGYDQAVAAANQRLQVFHTGVNPELPIQSGGAIYSRYTDPGDTSDIVDPLVQSEPCHPIPTKDPGVQEYPFPRHPHWVDTDLTDPPGPWAPRQSNWPNVLVDQVIPPPASGCTSPAGAQQAYADQVAAVHMIPKVHLSDVASYADPNDPKNLLPFGLWDAKPGCNFASTPTVQSYTGASRPHWMDVVNPPATAPVYTQSPGEAVFKMICINCHGPDAAATGRFAQNLATMTSGGAAVADFRNGLFGPTSNPGANLQSVFGMLPADADADWTGATADDRAARYMAWMALGGTPVEIPLPILEIVAITKVLDHQRVLSASSLSANMLSQAKAMCLSLLGPGQRENAKVETILTPGEGHGYLDSVDNLNFAVIPENGDLELWLRLCSMANPSPVHVLTFDSTGLNHVLVKSLQDTTFTLDICGASASSGAQGALVPASVYPPNTPVGNEHGGIDSSLDSTTNEWPWCVDPKGATPDQVSWLNSVYGVTGSSGGTPPWQCPASIISLSEGCLPPTSSGKCLCDDDANTWAVRGAVNAGLSVFLYVKWLETHTPLPDYNQCESLK